MILLQLKLLQLPHILHFKLHILLKLISRLDIPCLLVVFAKRLLSICRLLCRPASSSLQQIWHDECLIPFFKSFEIFSLVGLFMISSNKSDNTFISILSLFLNVEFCKQHDRHDPLLSILSVLSKFTQ